MITIYRPDPEFDPATVLTARELSVLAILEHIGATGAPATAEDVAQYHRQQRGLPADWSTPADAEDIAALDVLIEHDLATHGGLPDHFYYPTRRLRHLPVRRADRWGPYVQHP